MRIGIIGFGKMGRTRAAAVEAASQAKIVSVFDTVQDPETPYPFAASAEAIVQDPSLDAVFVCTPNWLNRPLTIAALQAGKHVFCEKPPCFTAAEMREIRAAEAASGKVLMYGFNHRHHGAILRMKELVDEGRFGRILWMRGRYGKSVDADYLTGWRADKRLAGGGILLDQGIHMLDLFLHLAGEPFDEVHAMISNLYWKTPGIEDNVFALLRNRRTGLSVSFHSTMTQWRHLFSLEVFLERGYLVLNGLKTSSGTYGEEVLTVARNRAVAPAATFDSEERFHFEVDSSWQRETDAFFEAIRTGAPVQYGSSAQALQVMELVDNLYTNERHESEELREALLSHAD
ncbi:Gfo/Idh/MocA family protein [Roseomonas sp. BN140053]|uniref:Gfo/Idh/MocA family protein n=1 Tax=Roseomonas sp. BN140053 TaxID=3391898 RepID=UPI0039EAEA01